MKRSELFFSFLLIPVDLAALILAFTQAYYVRLQSDTIYVWSFPTYLKFVISILPFFIIIFGLEGLYNLKNTRRGFDEFAGIFLGVSGGIMLVVAYLFLSRTEFFSRLVVIYAWLLAIALVTIFRAVVRMIQQSLLKYGVGIHRVLVIGVGKPAKNLVQQIQVDLRLGYKFVKMIDRQAIPKLDQLVKRTAVDEIVIADPSLTDREISQVIEYAAENELPFRLVPNLFRAQTARVEFTTIGDVPILDFHPTPLQGWGKIIKRLFDIIGSIVGLIIFSPFFLLIAFGIKLSSPEGPILFRQQRVGINKNFTFLKFRTMYLGADLEHEALIRRHGNMFKLKDDPRVFPFGNLLRRTSLDELPQLFNVLKGEMSLIGPRPPLPEEVKYYNSFERKRLRIKPGITGLWQVSGRSELDFGEWVRLDIYYIEHWSLWLDFQILLKTFWVVITRSGAY